ncbi:MAG: RNA ligase partner protein [bacterium]
MESYVLDTNLFFNREPGLGVGVKAIDILKATTIGILKLKKLNNARFFMPPSIVKELRSFFEEEPPILKDFFAEIIVKSPNISQTSFPASVFYSLVKEIKERILKGKVASEDELYKAASSLAPIELKGKKEIQIKVGEFTKNLRDRYRQATRTGFLDSLADLDLIVLSKEESAYLVSTDEGVVLWGRKFGVKEMDPIVFGKKLMGSD